MIFEFYLKKFQSSILFVNYFSLRMVAIVKIKVVSARNLPVMDQSQETTDAYVEVNQKKTQFR
jgi:hypothetical protein